MKDNVSNYFDSLFNGTIIPNKESLLYRKNRICKILPFMIVGLFRYCANIKSRLFGMIFKIKRVCNKNTFADILFSL